MVKAKAVFERAVLTGVVLGFLSSFVQKYVDLYRMEKVKWLDKIVSPES
jgi:hypothetical protein